MTTLIQTGRKEQGEKRETKRGRKKRERAGEPERKNKKSNYFTSSDPHHDMLGGGCQVRVVIENMMGRMENLRTLISGFLGLVILVRWALELLRQAAASIGLMSA